MKANKKFWFAALTFVFAAVIFVIIMAILFWSSLSIEEKTFLGNIMPAKYVLVLCLPLLLGLLLAINTLYKLYIVPLGKLAEEIALINTANPSHRIRTDTGKSIQNIAALVNQGAERYQELERNVKEKISLAKAQVEDERNTLAAFISELSEGVVICNADGRILLYNKQAKDFLTKNASDRGASAPYIGLGRSVFGLIDKNVIVHALDDIAGKLRQQDENIVSYFVTVGSNRRQLKTEAVPIVDGDKNLTGFILILYDITRQLETDNKVDILLKSLTKDIRASLGGVRAAIEALIDFPEMDPEKITMFRDIIHKESMNLSEVIEKTESEYSDYIHNQWPLLPMPAVELIESITAKAQEKLNISVDVKNNKTEDYWVKVEGYSLHLAMLFILDSVNKVTGEANYSCSLKRERKFVYIDLIWEGEPIKIENLRAWDDMALAVNDEHISHSLKEVMKHHEARITPYSLPDSPELSALRLLLPATNNIPKVSETINKRTISTNFRPDLYDFDLFNQPGQNPQLDNTPLTELVFTVFDTETTGLDPSRGDEIISIGAMRLVNMRILHEEIFDQLVDPKRSVPRASIEIHGIQPEMLKGQPDIDTVLPRFYKFVEETILIGHNAAFDMAMFKAKENQTGIVFPNPVLDTLMLSSVVHPEQDSHTMEAIAGRLGVSIVGRHSSFGDALTTGEMFLKLVPLLAAKGIRTLKEAREASQKTYYARLKY